MTRPTRRPIARPPGPRRGCPARGNTPRGGFTLLEVVIVVAILAVLSSLLVVGVEKMNTSAKRQQTRATLELCRSLYADYDTVARLHFTPSVMPCPQNVTADLNPIPATGPADDTKVANRYGAAVWFTRDVLFNLRSTPANAAALGKLSPSGLMTFPPVLNGQLPDPYGTNVLAAAWSNVASYTPFDTTRFGRVFLVDPGDPTNQTYDYYDCIQAVPAGSGAAQNLSPAIDRLHWLPAYPVIDSAAKVTPDDAVPVLLDAWGDPIIFVPGGILASGAALAADGSIVPGSGAMRSGTGTAALTTQAKSPDGRPFFASAGPDGDFSKGDDNLYSYEK